MPRVHVIVRGRVQGVGYRWFAVHRARQRGVTGWVRNLRDGTVEAELEGASSSLDALLADLREGPAGSAVSSVDVDWSDQGHGHTRFEIRD